MGDIFDSIPDPYVALGVSRDADAAAIKTAYRKLVLKCHPDKVVDATLKQAAADKFHIIQTSYERLSDEKSRARYDAEAKLAQLKKERAQDRAQRSGDERPVRASYRSSQDVPRTYYARREASPVVEERRPAYATHPEASSRSSRREADYERSERSSRRQVPHSLGETLRGAAKTYKEKERSERKEKSKKTTRETTRDRDSKYSRPYAEETSDSTDSDAFRSSMRRAREVDERRRMDREEEEHRRYRAAKDAYYEQAERQQEEAHNGQYFHERTRKMFEDIDRAKEHYSGRSRQSSAPYPTRDHVEVGPKGESHRRSANRTESYGREQEASPRAGPRERERIPIVEEASRPRAPTLNTTRSSPHDIRIPDEKPRAQSLQTDADGFVAPQFTRSRTMPVQGSRGRSDKPSRVTEFKDGYATPGATPDYAGPYPKYRYGKEYADDREMPTPEGYRTAESYNTEVREPPRESSRRAEVREPRTSASPVKEIREPREVRESRERPASSRDAKRPGPTPLRVKTTSYKFDGKSGVVEDYPSRSRPSISREGSSRDSPLLYGELRHSASASPRATSGPYSPGEDRYHRSFRPEEIRTQSGYSVKRGSFDARPEYSRSSSNAIGAR